MIERSADLPKELEIKLMFQLFEYLIKSCGGSRSERVEMLSAAVALRDGLLRQQAIIAELEAELRAVASKAPPPCDETKGETDALA